MQGNHSFETGPSRKKPFDFQHPAKGNMGKGSGIGGVATGMDAKNEDSGSKSLK